MRFQWLSKLALSTLAVAGIVACQQADGVIGPKAGASMSLTVAYEILEENGSSTGTVSAVIGGEGGQLSLGSIKLVVPAGAVDAPATFTMARGDTRLLVDLTATRSSDNDVGSAGFAKPLTLTMSYANAVNVSDPSRLKVFWIKPDGSVEAQPTTVDTGAKAVHGSISHFSGYATGSD